MAFSGCNISCFSCRIPVSSMVREAARSQTTKECCAGTFRNCVGTVIENVSNPVENVRALLGVDSDTRKVLKSGVRLATMTTNGALPRRIVKETQRLIAEPVTGISATPYQDNLRYFAVAIEGPGDSPYERGVFQLELFLPADYPMAPPKVRFLTKIYHPNVDKLGRICLDILKDKWSPALQIRTVLLSIQALLSAPNPDDPLDNTVAEVWKKNEAEAIRRAREFTECFAMKPAAATPSTEATKVE